jgi:hypothetical protein
MRFALMSEEEFVELVASATDFETLETMEAEILAELDDVEQDLVTHEVRRRLFRPRVGDFTSERERLREAMRPARETGALKRELGYWRKVRAIEHYREHLFFGAQAPEDVRRGLFKEALSEVPACSGRYTVSTSVL